MGFRVYDPESGAHFAGSYDNVGSLKVASAELLEPLTCGVCFQCDEGSQQAYDQDHLQGKRLLPLRNPSGQFLARHNEAIIRIDTFCHLTPH
jgi:hypothetical protein